jgi:hypothetical protein
MFSINNNVLGKERKLRLHVYSTYPRLVLLCCWAMEHEDCGLPDLLLRIR